MSSQARCRPSWKKPLSKKRKREMRSWGCGAVERKWKAILIQEQHEKWELEYKQDEADVNQILDVVNSQGATGLSFVPDEPGCTTVLVDSDKYFSNYLDPSGVQCDRADMSSIIMGLDISETCQESAVKAFEVCKTSPRFPQGTQEEEERIQKLKEEFKKTYKSPEIKPETGPYLVVDMGKKASDDLAKA